MIVMKFGGTSVGSAERMKAVAQIVQEKQQPVFLVLSAMSGITNQLEQLKQLQSERDWKAYATAFQGIKNHHQQAAEQLLERPAKALERLQNYWLMLEDGWSITPNGIMAMGEQLSTVLFQCLLEEQEVSSRWMDALSFMVLNEEGEPDQERIKHLLSKQINGANEQVFVCQGFICRDHAGGISNLQRGGSDYSASLIAAAIQAEACEIWTDIDGFHNNDPRFVSPTKSIAQLSYAEAAELAYFGAKILHPATVWPARQENIPVILKNTMSPELPGTRIWNDGTSSGFKAVAAKDGITAISIRSARMLMAYGFLSKVFAVFERYKTAIDVITTSEVAVSMTIDRTEQLQGIVQELEALGEVSVTQNLSIVCVVGHNIGKEKGLAAPLFEALQDIPIRMISFGGSDHNISVLIEEEHKKDCLNRLNQHLFFPNHEA